MDFKSARLEIKSLDDTGQFVGMAAVYNNVDLGGDLIEGGAFGKSLLDRGATTPLLWNHDTGEPIGVGRLTETHGGLQVEGKLIFDDNPAARRTYALMKGGAITGLSIGFETLRQVMQGSVRHLKELRLFEVSLCAIPMNPLATVASVKTLPDHREELAAINQLRQTIRKAMR